MQRAERLAAAFAYLAGSILPAEILARRLGTSMRELGDNPGGAGTWRKLGRRPAVAVVAFDMAKGALGAWLARRVATSDLSFAVVCAAPVAGHNWPPYLRFRGGRGLGPAAGALAVLAWRPFLAAFGLGTALALPTRWVPTVGVVALPAYLALLRTGGYPRRKLTAAAAVSLTVAVRQLPWVWGRLQEALRTGRGR